MADDRRFKWTASGVETRPSPGSREIGFEESGTVEAENGSEALAQLLHVGWPECLDTNQAYTITIEPAND